MKTYTDQETGKQYRISKNRNLGRGAKAIEAAKRIAKLTGETIYVIASYYGLTYVDSVKDTMSQPYTVVNPDGTTESRKPKWQEEMEASA